LLGGGAQSDQGVDLFGGQGLCVAMFPFRIAAGRLQLLRRLQLQQAQYAAQGAQQT
jgi:hypothetical protein